LEWNRGLQARVEKLRFKLAGNSEDVVPSIYATFGRDILVNELWSLFCKMKNGYSK
jgi:hypothetical protein